MMDFKGLASKFKLTPNIFYSYIFFIAAYAILVLLPAPQSSLLKRYAVSATGFRLIELSIVLILAIIWYAAFYGYTKLYQYSKLIRKERDGKQIYQLTMGVGFLAFWLPVSETVSALLNYIASKHIGLIASTTIVSNYLNLLLPLVGFVLIGRGANGLVKLIRRRPIYNYNLILGLAAALSYVCIIYMHLVVSSVNRNLIYHLSFWMICLTIVAPYVFMWAIGIVAVCQVYLYKQNIEGIVYKASLRNLALGIGWLVVASIVFQYLSTIAPRLANLSVYLILAIVYALLLLLSVGFIFIALGAQKLKQIEEL